MVNWDAIRKEWETTKITLAALAEKHDVKLGTLKSRKSREGWSRDPTKKDASKIEKVATIERKDATKKKGAPVGNSNGKGNKGNKTAAPPKRNSNALKHGFYAKHLPEEFLEIMDEVRKADPIDLIWEQIVIQYTSIIRAQKVMWVASGDDHLKEESGSSWGDAGGGESFKVSFAYEQYYAYLSVQSRAMAELRNLIKQFDEQAHVHDERRLKLEQMRIAIDKSKAEIEKLNSNNDDGPIEILIKRKQADS
ncbi:phage terminase small subunit [Bacillus sp. 37MA]|uniref:phage terminase small subunit n=1 Tax=Bacillus sp. 37MA TaxID=1132442 RepID=UPI0003739B4E|nr:phage terminase small subunit [Bacillus sp. 37MA]